MYRVIIAIILVLIIGWISIKDTNYEPFAPLPNNDPIDDMDIWTINLLDRPIKRAYMKDQFDKYDIKCKFFDAVNGKDLDLDKLKEEGVIDPDTSVKYFKRVLRRGEIGCAMSHLNIWLDLLKSDKKYALIFEDDAILTDDFRNKLNDVMYEVNTTNWDILYLNENCYNHFGRVCNGQQVTDNILRPVNVGYGLYGYVVKKESVKKIINDVLPFIVPIDNFLIDKHKINDDFVVLRLKDPIVGINRKFDSDTIKIK